MPLSGRSISIALTAIGLVAASASPARADITAFLGTARQPVTTSSTAGLASPTVRQTVTGAAFGMGLLVVGFEIEGASYVEDTVNQVPGLKTGMANVMVQTPTGGAQLYATTGAGIFHETLGTDTDTNVATNIGGGLKIALAGPLRLRVDYRLIHLRGRTASVDANVQRFYVGLNLKF